MRKGEVHQTYYRNNEQAELFLESYAYQDHRLTQPV